jgi:hypothetical protein
MHQRRILAAILILLASACSSVSRDDSGGLTEEASIPVTDFQIGDCFDDPNLTEVEEVRGLPCDRLHDNEVYAIFDHESADGPWPGQDAMDEYAFSACIDRFQTYVGADYIDSRLDVAFFSPLEAGWNDGDHEIACFLYDLDFAKLTGSMQNSAE